MESNIEELFSTDYKAPHNIGDKPLSSERGMEINELKIEENIAEKVLIFEKELELSKIIEEDDKK